MVTLSEIELRNVFGGALGRHSVPGTTIYKVPPKEVVCNQEQFDWMAERVGKSVQAHVVAADAALCGFSMPGVPAAPTRTTGPAPSGAQGFMDTIKFDELHSLAGSK